MKGRLTQILASNGQRVVTDLDRVATLEELQREVGGPIEVVPYFFRFEGATCMVFCNENGKIKNLPFNLEATKLWAAGSTVKMADDVLVGDVVICTGDNEFLDAL